MIRARIEILLAALLWSTSGLFVKSPPLAALGAAPWGGVRIACVRTLFAALALAPFVPWRELRWAKGMGWLLLSFTAMNVLFITAMTLTDAGDVIFLQYTAPFWVLVAGAFLLREPILARQAAAVGLALAGVFVVAGGALGQGRGLAMVLALGSGMAYAGVTLALRALQRQDPVMLVFLCHLVAGIVLLPWLFLGGVNLETSQWSLSAGLGIFQMAVAYLLYARGLRLLPAQEASLLALIEPVLNPIWVWLVWAQPIAGHTLIGGCLILGALVLRYASASDRHPAPGSASEAAP